MEVRVIFTFSNRSITALCKEEEKMDEMYQKFINKLDDDSKVEHYIYYYEGNKLDHNGTISKNKYIANKKEINISVQKKLRIIKCPTCKCNDCIINLDNYLANFYGYKNGHTHTSVYDEYINNQKIDSSELRCNESNCQNNQQNYIKGFYKCLKCSVLSKRSIYIFKDHNENHAEDQVRVKYHKKNYYCEKHYKNYIKYYFTHKQDVVKIV